MNNDDEGEPSEQFISESKETFNGKYGDLYGNLYRDAFYVEISGVAASASLTTHWKGKPLLAFSVTDPDHQRKGLAKALIEKSISMLFACGQPELF